MAVSPVTRVVLSHDGRRAALECPGGINRTAGALTVWDMPTGRQIYHQVLPSVVGFIGFSPDGNRIALARGRARNGLPDFQVVDLQTGRDLWSRPGGWGAADFSPDGRRLALQVNDPPRPKEILVLDAATGQHQLRLEGDDNAAGRVLFSPDGQRILTLGRDVRIWDAVTGEELLVLAHAIAAYRQAVAIDPLHQSALANLRDALLAKGRFAEARTYAAKVTQLFNKFTAEWPIVQDRVVLCDRLVALEPRVPDLLAGKVAPAGGEEALRVAQLCVLRREHA